MKDSEGSEPIKLTEQERIEKEANQVGFTDSFKRGYIAGANAQLERCKEVTEATIHRIFHKELKEERNKAIEDCVALVGNQPTIDSQRWPEVKRKLQALKSEIKR